MGGALNGYLIAIREVPGFLLIFVAAILLRQGLARATAIALVVAGVGYMLFAGANSFVGLIVPTLISSIGYHSWLQLQDALGLSLAKHGEEGSVLGRFRSIGFAGTIVALIVTAGDPLRAGADIGRPAGGPGPVAARASSSRPASAPSSAPWSSFASPSRRTLAPGQGRAADHLAQEYASTTG
jgi:hypothetical protein